MRRDEAISALAELQKNAPKRKFTQSIELMINFTGLDMKKPTNQVNVKVALPYPTGKGSGKVLVFAKNSDFADSIKDRVDKVVLDKEIEALAKDRAKVGEVMTFDGIFAEGPSMLTVAKYLGQQLAPKGKMPKLIPNANAFDEILAKARTQVTVSNKKGRFMPVVHAVVGREGMKNEEMAENMLAIYDSVMNSLPQKKQNIKNAYIKMTMSPPIKVGETQGEVVAGASKQVYGAPHMTRGEKK
jgi:large subunit ribosomal protein L1